MTRIDTGVLQIDTDWPGIFLRGDAAMYYSFQLRKLLRALQRGDLDATDRLTDKSLQEFAIMMSSCNVSPGNDVHIQHIQTQTQNIQTQDERTFETVTFYGASDDLVEVTGIDGADEFCSDEITFIVVSPDGDRIRVDATYDGLWGFRLLQVEEEDVVPSWPVRFTPSPTSHSIQLEIDVPVGTTLMSASL